MKLDHTGIAVRRINEAIDFYTTNLGGKLVHQYTSEKPGVETHIAVIEMDNQVIELLEPTSKTSPIERFIRQKGKGVHHLAYEVDNLEETIREYEGRGITFLKDTYRINPYGRRLIYINPVHTQGTIIELCDYIRSND
ncbi:MULTISPECIES: VOC family protein [unclassified Fictibacillus]|uniref:VOC family protein n=1 Tax=unclassified Fictibacillus TaxID=2644029 RepID=UPI0007844BD0|nr:MULTISPECIES: VOC family protein [unclassified Fictibacillus]MED2971936.1 VOC family protein [Fictibacillus sp. B-59209]UZJ77641.1 VOC family protein [Fictibacillus sp. KU28468]